MYARFKSCQKRPYQACKNLVCNLDILHVALSGVRRDTHPQQNSNHILRTTSTRAYAVDCIRAGTHTHLPFYTTHAASVYRRWPDARALAGVWAAVLAAGSSRVTVKYASEGSEGDQEDNQQVLVRAGISDRLHFCSMKCRETKESSLTFFELYTQLILNKGLCREIILVKLGMNNIPEGRRTNKWIGQSHCNGRCQL